MIADLKPYPAMKDSGVEWLGEVPEHWEVRRLRNISGTPIRNGVGESAQAFREDWPRYIRITDIAGPRKLKQSGKASLPPEFGQAASVERGALLLAAVGATYGKSYLHTIDSRSACYAGYLVKWLPTNNVVPEWASYWTESNAYWDQVHSCVIKSTIENFSASRYRRLSLSLPPLPEQAAIVRYLDHVDRRVRRLVRAKRKLIALLTEQKQAIIHRAVTRGLDPDVPLKDSGVEWLGQVPEHWEVRRGKYFFREVDERSTTGLEELLSVSHLTGVTPRSQKNITMFKAESYVGSKICKPGQIAINTMWAWMGPTGVSRHHGIVSPSYHTYEQKPPARFAEDYLDLLLRTDVYKTLYRINSTGITSSRMRLYPEEFLNIEFLCPPLEEQNVLLDSIQVETQALNNTITRAEREIELLNEYRTRLIADVVTGKLDVRDAAAALPEVDPLDAQADLDDPLDEEIEEDLDEAADIPEGDDA